jgi:formate hydrogenlyase subunit 3/multisubunit Na+/H+ antiporter MnhD subunit
MFGFQQIGKTLIIFGLVLVALGGLFMMGDKIPFLGKLPGDIHIQRENFSFYFPLVTCIIISLILTVILNLFRR